MNELKQKNNAMTKKDHLTWTFDTLKQIEDEVVEIRILNTKQRTISGYFDDVDKAIEAIQPYDGKHDIYVTLNPVKKNLITGSINNLKTFSKTTTKDQDIDHLRFILIDVDPIRKSGISSTNEEKEAAWDVIESVRSYLELNDFSKPALSSSGNGYHLLIELGEASNEVENNRENVQVIKEFLATLDLLFSTDQAQVDLTTYNPSRIVKWYGTTSCKGEHSSERPHRRSEMINDLDETYLTTMEDIQKITKINPEKPSQTEEVKGTKIDLMKFIEQHQLDLAYSSPYQQNATKFILQTCPWNSDHKDKAAYLIQFENGAVSAGCHHDGCSGENWQSLKTLLGIESNMSEPSKSDKQSDTLLALTKDFQFFTDEMEGAYAAVWMNDHREVFNLKERRFYLYLTKLFYEEENTAPGGEAIAQTLSVMEMYAAFSDNEEKLQKRMAKYEGSYFYDLCDPKWQAIKINEAGCTIEKEPPILFTRSKNMNEQVIPDFTVEPKKLPELVKKHFRFKRQSDIVLFTVYLITCFIPDIAHVITLFYGEKGSAKSTTMRMVKRIIDPSKQDLLIMPNKENLAITLTNNYMPCFDNLDSISKEVSDTLCMAATGGALTKRTLYTDSDETILQIKRNIALNGINIVATRSDLLDRSILLELERIPKNERATEKQIWEEFEEDIPKFLGAMMNALSQAMKGYGDVELDEVGRMADFTYWGYAIAETLELSGESFLNAYLHNQNTANEEALSSNPVAAAVMALVSPGSVVENSVTELYKKLEQTAFKFKINTRSKIWPKDASVLTKRLNEIKSNLEEVGIYYDHRHAGNYKMITLTREDQSVVNKTKHDE